MQDQHHMQMSIEIDYQMVEHNSLPYIQDRLFTGERQIMIINTLHDTGRGLTMMNQYGSVETTLDLGSFDFVIDGVESVLRFFPHKFTINDYNVVLWSYQIDTNQLGVSTTNVATATTSIPAEPLIHLHLKD